MLLCIGAKVGTTVADIKPSDVDWGFRQLAFALRLLYKSADDPRLAND